MIFERLYEKSGVLHNDYPLDQRGQKAYENLKVDSAEKLFLYFGELTLNPVNIVRYFTRKIAYDEIGEILRLLKLFNKIEKRFEIIE